jgi:hypothetical protein
MKLLEYELGVLGYVKQDDYYMRPVDHHSIQEERDRIDFHFSINRFKQKYVLIIHHHKYLIIDPKIWRNFK